MEVESAILTTLAVAIFLGIAAQVLAARFKLPAILPLLLLGFFAGSSRVGFGWVEPGALGHGLEVFIHLGVAIILFEGGLSLDLRQLMRVGGAVRNLLTLGVAVTAVGAAAAAHYLTAVPWSTAALFGAIVTVTGPTVIRPLLRHMIAPREVRTVLLSEGLLIDPIGVVLAYVVLQWISLAEYPVKEAVAELILLALTGAAVGFLAGSLARVVAKSRHLGSELRNLGVLALLVMAFMLSEHQAEQSGILAAVVMGVTLSGSNIPDLVPLKTFKEQLTTLVISVLFILLSAQLDFDAMLHLGWRGLAVVGLLILAVRPLAVLSSIWREKGLGPKERLLLALTAPRGIVAAAFASLAARQLQRSGLAGGPELEGLVYLAIFTTCAWATVMAVLLPHLLGYRRDPSRRLTVMVGASPMSQSLSELLHERGRSTMIIDSSRRKVDEVRRSGLAVATGDARDASIFEDVGVEADTVVLAMTPNDELNLLVASLAHEEFGVAHPVVVLQRPSDEFGTRRHAWVDLFGGRAVDLTKVNKRLEAGKSRFLSVDLSREGSGAALRRVLREHEGDALAVCGWQGAQPTFARVLERLEDFGDVTLLVHDPALLEELEQFASEPEEQAPAARQVSADDAAATE